MAVSADLLDGAGMSTFAVDVLLRVPAELAAPQAKHYTQLFRRNLLRQFPSADLYASVPHGSGPMIQVHLMIDSDSAARAVEAAGDDVRSVANAAANELEPPQVNLGDVQFTNVSAQRTVRKM